MGCGGSHNAAGQEPSKKTKINKNEQKQKLEELGIDSGKLRGMLMQMAKAFKPQEGIDEQPYSNHLTNLSVFNVDKIYEYQCDHAMPCNFQRKAESSGESMQEHIESNSKTVSLTAGASCFSGTISKSWNDSTTNKTTKAFRDVIDYIERARFEMPNIDFDRPKLRQFVVDKVLQSIDQVNSKQQAETFYNKVSYYYISMATFGGSQIFNMTSTSELSSLMKEEVQSVDVEGSYEGASLKAGLSSSNKNTNTTSKGDSKIKQTLIGGNPSTTGKWSETVKDNMQMIKINLKPIYLLAIEGSAQEKFLKEAYTDYVKVIQAEQEKQQQIYDAKLQKELQEGMQNGLSEIIIELQNYKSKYTHWWALAEGELVIDILRNNYNAQDKVAVKAIFLKILQVCQIQKDRVKFDQQMKAFKDQLSPYLGKTYSLGLDTLVKDMASSLQEIITMAIAKF